MKVVISYFFKLTVRKHVNDHVNERSDEIFFCRNSILRHFSFSFKFEINFEPLVVSSNLVSIRSNLILLLILASPASLQPQRTAQGVSWLGYSLRAFQPQTSTTVHYSKTYPPRAQNTYSVIMVFTVHFTVTIPEPLKENEFVFVTGNALQLGEWDPEKALKLQQNSEK